MARRMIDTGMWGNESFAELPAMGRLLLIGIITIADDQGRCKANPAYLRSQIFPYDDIATGDVDCWLEQMAANETVILYEVAGKAYLQMVNWWEYQPLDWARPSDYPAPKGWQDRIRFNAKGNVNLTYNWRTKSGNCPPDNCDSKGNPLSTRVEAPTQVPTLVPTQASTQVNQSNLNQTKSSPVGDDPVDDSTAADDALGLVKFIQSHGFVYLDRNHLALATQLMEAFGWDRCVAGVDKLKAAHSKQVQAGQRGILAPLAYLRSVLEGDTAKEAASNNGFVDSAWQQLNQDVPDYMKG